MDNILFWNARGAGGGDFRYAIVDLVKMNNTDLLVICESRVQFSRAKDHLLNIGFTDYEIVEANGFSGGLWLLWNRTKFQIHMVDSNSQSITVKVSANGVSNWLFTGLYASPCSSTRQGLWSYLTAISKSTQLPWIIIGDFNELVSYSDKNGGSYAEKFGGLKTWVQNEAMIDMGYQGADYTWSNGRVKERLDRVFALNGRVDPPFRFQAMWMQHEEYKEFVTSAWNNTAGSLLEKTKGLATNLSTWNRDIFGNEYQIFSHYYNGEKKKKKVDGLFAEDGTWSENPAVMKNIAKSFFQNLFTIEEVPDLRFTIPNLFPTVELTNIKELAAPVCYQEIRSALFSIGGMKAPGFDGFPALFFQNHWELCKVEVIKIVTNAFIEGRIPEGLNHTLITLVPKVQGPKHMHLFRPISLCCTVYKIITKIIVSRIRPFLKKWISPNQVSFVPGRHISDNVMVTQEILHKCRYAKGKKGFLVWKIDLSKAYDKLNWNFINQVLYELQIPDQLTKLIMHCITSPSFQVILNGDLSDKFSAGRGVRQGDPLSPYIFVLCMEKLSHLIHSATEVGQWKPIQSSQSGPLVSHLFFADDIILFAEASTTQAKVLKKCMDLFCSLSGQTVNFEKSKIYVSPNVRNNLAKSISRTCGSPLTKDLGKYLGMPLLHSRLTKHTYSEMVDKVHSRLAGWKCKTLSMAGRLTLINSVTASIPIYTMQTAKIPISTCDSLDKLNRDFLWGDCDGRKTVHLVNWDNVCMPKIRGALGIKKTAEMNQALLAKVSWRLLQKDEGLWCDIYIAKYLKHDDLLSNNYKHPANCSATWRSICSRADLLRKGVTWRIGDGGTAYFWTDYWSECGVLSDLAVDPSMVDPSLLVQDFWEGKDWDITMLFACLPPEIAAKIISIPIDNFGGKPDKIIWKHTSDGNFTVKSAFSSIGDHYQPGDASTIWNEIGMPVTMARAFRLDWDDWIAANLLQKNCTFLGFQWSQLFIYICWFIWKWRNKSIFDTNFQKPHNAASVIIHYISEWANGNMKPRGNSIMRTEMLSWLKPSPGHFKLNVDGSRTHSGLIGAGGVIRDNDGNWTYGFMRNLGNGEVLKAEAWGLMTGLSIASHIGKKNIKLVVWV
ncbi:uncharacterized protein LOC133711840 [Rosa rugosa]|uniref:uncharacterized protein LOC133711840 n=1 Tax=Rosa rugosa TaxID=74645 RepID=UPI002B40B878|nr:uncharacterized protein LOC133711840 [Rosa rugosa]